MHHRSSSAPISGMLTNHPHSDILILSGHLNRPYPTPTLCGFHLGFGLGQVSDDGHGTVVGPYQGDQYKAATSFTTGDNALGYHPTGAQLYLRRLDADSPAMDVSIRQDNAGVPSETMLSSLTTSTAVIADTRLTTFTTSDEVTLQPNTKYWLHVTATGTRAAASQTDSDKEDTQSQADWSIAQGNRVLAA